MTKSQNLEDYYIIHQDIFKRWNRATNLFFIIQKVGCVAIPKEDFTDEEFREELRILNNWHPVDETPEPKLLNYINEQDKPFVRARNFY